MGKGKFVRDVAENMNDKVSNNNDLGNVKVNQILLWNKLL